MSKRLLLALCCALCAGGDLYAAMVNPASAFNGTWAAVDYLTPVKKTKNVFDKYTGEAMFSVYDTKKGPMFFQAYNFHEGAIYAIKTAKLGEDGLYTITFSSAPKDGFGRAPVMLSVLEYENGEPQILLRNNPDGQDLPWRVYVRVEKKGGPDAGEHFDNMMSDIVLGGAYTDDKNNRVEFGADGKGRWGTKTFTYTVITDYVLGPACNLMVFKDNNAPLKGVRAFARQGGNLVFLETPDEPNSAAGISCGTKVLAELKPLAAETDLIPAP